MIYRLYVARWDPDGTVSRPLEEHLITAEDTSSAIRQARSLDIDMDAVEGNALFLEEDDGALLWSIRRQDIAP